MIRCLSTWWICFSREIQEVQMLISLYDNSMKTLLPSQLASADFFQIFCHTREQLPTIPFQDKLYDNICTVYIQYVCLKVFWLQTHMSENETSLRSSQRCRKSSHQNLQPLGKFVSNANTKASVLDNFLNRKVLLSTCQIHLSLLSFYLVQ